MWAGEAERKVCGEYEMGKNYKKERREKNLSDYINSKDWALAMSTKFIESKYVYYLKESLNLKYY